MTTTGLLLGEILDRVRKISGATSDAAIARALGVTPQAIGNARRRGTIPFERLVAFAAEHGVSLDYLFLGKAADAPQVDFDLLDEIYGKLSELVAGSDLEAYVTKPDMMSYLGNCVYHEIIHRRPDAARGRVQIIEREARLLLGTLAHRFRLAWPGRSDAHEEQPPVACGAGSGFVEEEGDLRRVGSSAKEVYGGEDVNIDASSPGGPKRDD